MRGLCATCNIYGYKVFGCLKNLIQKEINSIEIQNNFIQRAENLQRFLKRLYKQKFIISENGITKHNPCINHCLLYAFRTCDRLHTQICNKCQELFTFFDDLKEIIGLASLNDLKIYEEKLIYYLSHQMRKVYLNFQFNATILKLDEKGAVFLVNYKMKVLPQTARETNQDFYSKKEWSLHSVLVYVKSNNSQIRIEAFDHWSCNAKQDAWFTASSLHGVIEALDKKPEWISIISDNKAGEISQSIRRRVKLGFEIRNSENIQEAIKDIAGICVAHLEPDRDNDGYIQARALPHIGEWKTFTPNQISNWMKDEVHMPQPQISLHTTLKSFWKIPIPHSSMGKGKQLQEELENQGIMVNEKENRAGMIEILENKMTLKHNQKYGKKGSGKRITPQVIALLERFFLDGNVHKNRRMNENNMRDKLVEKQESGELAHDIEIPEVSSINN
ncbi:hypothetical protein RclHR1_05170001 [Rhizophagus clarus]|uniref:Uncharacterized protein n=1 Tax=Rhizophagus clarus TaxID=94130 RepID=A0A2Z6RMR3_9GLOM|nr:hypothetical protein RclHR1_05170001 [Rhizophagus clarus]